jgi:hypothetical protein
MDEFLSLEEQIAHRAYDLRQQRGHYSKPGGDWTDWFHAEREITQWSSKAASNISKMDRRARTRC